MADVVCHLGLHKTASGTLQRQFFPACRGLNLLTTQMPAVRQLVQLITCKDPLYFQPEQAYGEIAEFLRPDQVNLLSNESLSGPPYAGVVEWGLDHRSSVIQNLRSVFPNARIIVVLRRQDALARSLYRQYVKRGGTATIRQFYGMDDSGRPPLMSRDRFLFSQYIRLLHESFQGRVLVLKFEEFLRDQPAFLTQLCQFIGTEMPALALRRENATNLGPVGMEVTRLMNFGFRSMLNRSILPGVPLRSRGRWKEVSPVELIHDYWPGKPGHGERSDFGTVSGAIWDESRDDNRRLDQDYGLGLAESGYY